VIWIFMGWEFTLAEFLGGLLLIAFMWAGLRLFVTRRLEEEARAHAQQAQTGHVHPAAGSTGLTWRQRLTSVDAWTDVAHNFRGDWEMLWKEIGAGFLIAGFVALLPMSFFNGLFLTDAPAWIRIPENVIMGPIVAVLSFVCSIGNVPLAAVLWAGGISFSGVIAFIYADLLVIPILLIYRKYYGTRVAVLFLSIMLGAIVLAALAVSAAFALLGLIPSERPDVDSITERAIGWNYTTFLNIAFLAVAAVLIGLTLRPGLRDPVCGMTVSGTSPFKSEWNGTTYFFCGPGCKGRFDADPARYAGGARAHEHAHQH
jgi:YHS domain-containing protein